MWIFVQTRQNNKKKRFNCLVAGGGNFSIEPNRAEVLKYKPHSKSIFVWKARQPNRSVGKLFALKSCPKFVLISNADFFGRRETLLNPRQDFSMQIFLQTQFTELANWHIFNPNFACCFIHCLWRWWCHFRANIFQGTRQGLASVFAC